MRKRKPLFLTTRLTICSLIEESGILRILKILELHLTLREKEIAAIWFSNAQEKLELLLKNNILETGACLLLAENNDCLQYPINVLSARICRQYSNDHNTLTLDRDGFTLSHLFPKPIRCKKRQIWDTPALTCSSPSLPTVK